MVDVPPDSGSVAVVMPVFNTGAVLLESVQSVREQTFPCQLVVVDDGSTDPETLECLDRLGDTALVLRQDNAGAASARNRGIAAADADLILPLDADDLIARDYVARAREEMLGTPDVGIVYCRAERFGVSSGPWELPDFSAGLMAVNNVIFISAMFRRADWETIGGFDESLTKGGEDWDFFLSILELGREVVQLPDRLFSYRITESSAGRSFRREDVVDLYATIMRKHPQFFLDHAEAMFEHRFALEDAAGSRPTSRWDRLRRFRGA